MLAGETDFIARLRAIASDPAARGLADDAALLDIAGPRLVLTQDMLVEGVHFRSDDPPEDVAWKLLAVNLSDLAAKGARPLACLMGYSLTADADWNARFADGLGVALAEHAVALIGGDTVAPPAGTARTLTLTAIGLPGGAAVPARDGARAGDRLHVTGTIGDGWAGLTLLDRGDEAPAALIAAYRRPRPRLAEGLALAPLVGAMMDVSDGLLIDAARIGAASGVGIAIDLDQVPLSPDFAATFGEDPAARVAAASGGDDYELLFAAAPDTPLPVPSTPVGRCIAGQGLTLLWHGAPVPLPHRLGWLHG